MGIFVFELAWREYGNFMNLPCANLSGTLFAQGSTKGFEVCIGAVFVTGLLIVGFIVLSIVSTVSQYSSSRSLSYKFIKPKEGPLPRYIRKARHLGVSKYKINERCQANGWSDDEIKDAWEQYYDNG